MSCPAHDAAIAAMLKELTELNFTPPPFFERESNTRYILHTAGRQNPLSTVFGRDTPRILPQKETSGKSLPDWLGGQELARE